MSNARYADLYIAVPVASRRRVNDVLATFGLGSQCLKHAFRKGQNKRAFCTLRVDHRHVKQITDQIKAVSARNQIESISTNHKRHVAKTFADAGFVRLPHLARS